MDKKRESIAREFQQGVERGRLHELRTNRNLCGEFVEELRVYTVQVLRERYPKQAEKLLRQFQTVIAVDLGGNLTEKWPCDRRLRCSLELRNLLAPQLGHWVHATAKLINPPEPGEDSPWTLHPPSEALGMEMKQIVEDMTCVAELAREYHSLPTGSTLEFAYGVDAALKALEKRGKAMLDALIEERSPVKMSRRRKRTSDEESYIGSDAATKGHGLGLLDDLVLRNHGSGRIAEPDINWEENRTFWYSCMGGPKPERSAGGQPIVTYEERLALQAIWHMEFDFRYGKDNPLRSKFTTEKVMDEAVRRVKERMQPMFSAWRPRPRKRRARKSEELDH